MYLIVSIDDRHFCQMLTGAKRYEFRRGFVSAPCFSFVYVPSPIREIRGYIEFGAPIAESPSRLVALALSQGSFDASTVLEYMRGVGKGYAVPIKEVRLIRETVSLGFLRMSYGFTAPQGYQVLDRKPELLMYLLNLLY